MEIVLKPAYDRPDQVKELFSEYTKILVEHDRTFGEYLTLQNYEEELEHLEMKYGEPWGRLYLAYADGKTAGCIGLRKISEEACEMKRLYVRPRFRGEGIGEQLVTQVIRDGKSIGYRYMLLDTLPFLEGAVRMYQKHGFYEVESYNNSPMDTSIYMRLDL